MTSSTSKDTIYIDVDDEITNIIDKINASDSKIVALVLPKRATVLQSIVNMKLLHRAATTGKKNLVLITSEASLLPLAGVVGLHVAKNLQSKPEIPPLPDGAAPPAASGDIDEEIATDPDLDDHKSVGELAGPASALPPAKALADETIELDDDVVPPKPSPLSKAAVPPKKAGKKFKIPNFERFRLLVILGGAGLIGLIVFGYLAAFVMPSATITIKTDSTTVNSNIQFTASTTAKALDMAKKIVPAKRQEVKKTDSEKAPATGQKDVGTKAAGTVTLTLTDCSQDKVTIPAGTGISSNNLTFILQTSATLSSVKIGDECRNKDFTMFTTTKASVTAQNAGDQYNLSPRSYQVAGFSNVQAADTDGMTGGTSRVIKVVSQTDIDTAKQKLSGRTTQTATEELKANLKAQGMYILEDTFQASEPSLAVAPGVNEEASEVTVTSITTYSLLGVNQDDLKNLVETNARQQIDTSKQDILDNGLGSASFIIGDAAKQARPQIPITIQALVKAGPRLDTEGIKREVAGKKKGPTLSAIQSRPAIKDVSVHYSPFWVSQTPKKLTKINIIFDQSDSKTKP